MWFYYYLVFLLLLILLLILILFPFWKKYNSVKKDRRALHFVATTMAFKNKQTKNPTKLAAHRTLHENKTAAEFTKIRAEVQRFSAHPSFAT